MVVLESILLPTAVVAAAVSAFSIIFAVCCWGIVRSAWPSSESRRTLLLATGLIPIALSMLSILVTAHMFSEAARDSDRFGFATIVAVASLSIVVSWPVAYHASKRIIGVGKEQ